MQLRSETKPPSMGSIILLVAASVEGVTYISRVWINSAFHVKVITCTATNLLQCAGMPFLHACSLMPPERFGGFRKASLDIPLQQYSIMCVPKSLWPHSHPVNELILFGRIM